MKKRLFILPTLMLIISISAIMSTVASAAETVDQFVAKYNGILIENHGYHECVALANQYNSEVVGCGFIEANWASDWYKYYSYDPIEPNYYTQVDAGQQPQKGDLAVWGKYAGTGDPHIALVIDPMSGNSLSCLTQNPGAAHIATLTRTGLLGYLRPKIFINNAPSTTPTIIAPTSANISIAKSTYTIGENVTFSFSGNNSPSFTIGIDKDSTRIDTTVCGSSYTRSFAEAGSYSAYVTAWNSAGHQDSARVYFTVANKDTILPSGNWIYPTSGIVFQPSGVMTLSVNASDNSGMGKVTFHALYDGSWHELGTATLGVNGTYGFNWNYAVGPQDVLINAHLYDAAGNYKNIEGPTIKFASIGLNNFEQQNEYRDGQFTDVPSGKWYSGNVGKAYGLGLMVGISRTTFSVLGNVTVAEAITMACRLNSIFYTGSENFVQDGGLWYSVYLTYAANNGITSKTYNSYTRAITRAECAEIFVKALPSEALAEINTVSDGAIPDVPASATYASSVYLLYRAGIIVGSDAAGTFKPTSNISRAEAAAIVTRMADISLRQSVTLTK